MSERIILAVDDNPLNLKLVAYILRRQGFVVKTAVDAHEALAALAQVRPGLILMDLQMPGIDGFELTQLIKKAGATQSIPVIAVTAFAMKGDDERARAAGCDCYITKPIDAKELLAAISQYWQGSPAPAQVEPSVPGADQRTDRESKS